MKQLAIFIIRLYQRFVSPYMSPRCKYVPTCSEYAVEAFGRFGFFKGFGLAGWRILRCNPFSKGGYDPVPQKRQKTDSMDK